MNGLLGSKDPVNAVVAAESDDITPGTVASPLNELAATPLLSSTASELACPTNALFDTPEAANSEEAVELP